MNKSIARAGFAAILVFGTATADAQITTVIEAPKRNEVKQQAAARRDEVAQDSITRVTMTGMKQWVDSAAAALAIRPDTGTVPTGDTAAISPATSAKPVARTDSAASKPTRPAAPPAEFRDGARAPNTGTPVPTAAVIGAIMILVGAMFRRRPSAAKARAPRR